MRQFLSIISIFAILFSSCSKKGTPVDDNNSNNNVSINSTVVYNVKKENILKLINEVRQSGCTCGTTVMPSVAIVSWNDLLAKAAYDHSVDMVKNNFNSHTGSNGSNPSQRIAAAGYKWTVCAENIAGGYTTEADVVNGWIKSEGHCKNLMNAKYKEMGVGREANKWTQEFGTK